jgi:DNA-binding Lrp family transcriptional regulator
MVTAIILLNVERDKVNEVARKLVDMQEISEAYSVSGRYDLAAIIRVKENEQLADAITTKLLKIEGILKTETLIAFRAYSRHDLECMFSIGID